MMRDARQRWNLLTPNGESRYYQRPRNDFLTVCDFIHKIRTGEETARATDIQNRDAIDCAVIDCTLQ